jgi:DNA-directed RNA polymerase subunit RPC12/RpoP
MIKQLHFNVVGEVIRKTANFACKDLFQANAPSGAAWRILCKALRGASVWVRQVRAFFFLISSQPKAKMNENTIVCACNHCSGNIEFTAEDAGRTAACPHCGIETILFDNRPKPKPVEPEPVKEKKILKATRIKRNLGGGIEDSLEWVADVIFMIGMVGGLIIGVVSLMAASTNSAYGSMMFYGIALAVAVCFQSWIFNVFMKAAAEIIRLLKKSSGLEYSGQISQPTIEMSPVCSNCSISVTHEQKRCQCCGAFFEIEGEK